jgi:5'(3')-deoxyribonucleotidase
VINTSKRDGLAIDMDDVLVDFVGGLLDSVFKEYGVRIPFEDTGKYGWDLRPLLDPVIGYNWWTWMRDREWIWANFPAIPGAIGSIERLRKDGYYLEVVTSKPKWAEHNVWKWLGKWRPAVNAVIITDPEESKADASLAHILIDDKPRNCEEWAASGRPAVLFSRPHNESTTVVRNPLIHRADSWADVRALVEQLTREPH